MALPIIMPNNSIKDVANSKSSYLSHFILYLESVVFASSNMPIYGLNNYFKAICIHYRRRPPASFTLSP
jgi:hypothetical protein